MNQDDDDLMNELLAQLDSNDTTVQAESANLLNDMDLNQQAATLETKEKQDAKSRFKARQVSVSFAASLPWCAHLLVSQYRPEKLLYSHSHTHQIIQSIKHDWNRKQKMRKLLFGRSAKISPWKSLRYDVHSHSPDYTVI
jgi:hypothetical protein